MSCREDRKSKVTGIIAELRVILAILLCAASFACQQNSSLAAMDSVLRTAWQSYREQFIAPEGRVMIPERRGGSISEGQAYGLLRAVWAGDDATFGRVYAWTYLHLSRVKTHGDSLLSWLWGPRPDGSWGVLDANTATDADLDYALALTLAARRGWRAPAGLPDYGDEARRVQADIWTHEVVSLPDGEPLLTPGNWHEKQPPYLVNPSYFSPAAYQSFGLAANSKAGSHAVLQPAANSGQPITGEGRGGVIARCALLLRSVSLERGKPDWERLRRGTYDLMGQINLGLGEAPGVGLVPDWCRVDSRGRVAAAPGRDTCFGWEAVRVPWRLALDYLWCHDNRAPQFLNAKFLPFFKKAWQAHGRLAAVYNLDGTPAVSYESPVMYAGVLAAALSCGDRDFAGEMAGKIISFYHREDGRAYFEAPDHYYANNWAWLGLALYADWVKPFQQ
jgi:endoglucanase